MKKLASKVYNSDTHSVEYINIRHNLHSRAKVCGVSWSLTSMGTCQIPQSRITLALAYVLNYLYIT